MTGTSYLDIKHQTANNVSPKQNASSTG